MYEQIAWFPLCAGLTGVGLVASFLLLRRRGAAAGLRMLAWSLIPMAAYLTGALPTLWRIGTSVVGFVTGLVFSPLVWIGVALAGLSVVLFMVSGMLRSRSRGAASGPAAGGAAVPGGTARPAAPVGKEAPGNGAPGRSALPKNPARKPADDDFSDIEDILKRRGIG
jgi:hypothetical protein